MKKSAIKTMTVMMKSKKREFPLQKKKIESCFTKLNNMVITGKKLKNRSLIGKLMS